MQTQLAQIVAQQPYPLVFATISGSHLYGFSSPDSDYDLRGVHLLPLRELVGRVQLEFDVAIERSYNHID
jgi:uncharacterized protein